MRRKAGKPLRLYLISSCARGFFMRIQRDYESYVFSLMARARRICEYNTTCILQSTLDIKIYETIHSLLAKVPTVWNRTSLVCTNSKDWSIGEYNRSLSYFSLHTLSFQDVRITVLSFSRSLFTRARCSLKYITRFRLNPWLCSSARNSLYMQMPRSWWWRRDWPTRYAADFVPSGTDLVSTKRPRTRWTDASLVSRVLSDVLTPLWSSTINVKSLNQIDSILNSAVMCYQCGEFCYLDSFRKELAEHLVPQIIL